IYWPPLPASKGNLGCENAHRGDQLLPAPLPRTRTLLTTRRRWRKRVSVRRRASGRAHYNYFRDYDPAIETTIRPLGNMLRAIRSGCMAGSTRAQQSDLADPIRAADSCYLPEPG